MLLTEDPVLNRWFNERYGDKLAEAEAKMAEAKAEAEKREATLREALREAQMREEEVKRREAEARRREAEAKRREAEAKAEAEAKQREAEWFPALTKYLAQRFANIPTQLLLDLQRVPVEQYGQVMNLALDAPDLATFQQELKGFINS